MIKKKIENRKQTSSSYKIRTRDRKQTSSSYKVRTTRHHKCDEREKKKISKTENNKQTNSSYQNSAKIPQTW